MALVTDNTPCSICGCVVRPDESTVATTHFIEDESDPLWKHSDSVMHRQCFLSWPHRKEFVFLYNSTFTPPPGAESVCLYLSQDGEYFRRHFPSGHLYPVDTPLQAIQQHQRSRGD
jgi:hypothetical protein